MCSRSSIVFGPLGQLEGWFQSWVPESVFDIEEVLTGGADSHVHLFVADVIKSFDTVDRSVLDRVLSSLGLPGWFRMHI